MNVEGIKSYRRIRSLINSAQWLVEEKKGTEALLKFENEIELIRSGSVSAAELYSTRIGNPRYWSGNPHLRTHHNNHFPQVKFNVPSSDKRTDYKKTDMGAIEDIWMHTHVDYRVVVDGEGETQIVAVNKRRRNFEEMVNAYYGIEEKPDKETEADTSTQQVRDEFEDDTDYYDDGVSKDTDENVSVVRHIWFVGVMTKYGGLSTKGIEDLCFELEDAYNDPKVSSIVLEMDTPGGSAQAAEMLRTKLNERNKPVVVSAINLLSGGMWSCCVADHIEANGTIAEFGSIGVYITVYNVDKMMEMEGIKEHSIYASDSTEKNKGWRDAQAGNYKYIIRYDLDPLNRQFQSIINESLNPAGNGWNTGRTYFSNDALNIGLCHGVGTFKTAILKAKNLSVEMEEQIRNADASFNAYATATVDASEGHAARKMETALAFKEAFTEVKVAAKLSDEKIAQLESDKKTLQEKINELTTQLEDAQKQTNNEGEESQVTELTQKNTDLSQQVKDLTDKLTATEKERDDFKTSLETANEKVTKVETELTTTKTKLSKQEKRTAQIIKANNLNATENEEGSEVEGDGVEGEGSQSGDNERDDAPVTKEQEVLGIYAEILGKDANIKLGRK